MSDEEKPGPEQAPALPSDPALHDFVLEPPTPHVVPRLTDDELRQFILAFCDGQLFSTAHMSPDDQSSVLASVFMPLAFGAFEGWTQEELAQIGLIYERLEKAGPRTCNGLPGFFSMRLLHKDDWKRAVTAIEAERERRKDIPLPPATPTE